MRNAWLKKGECLISQQKENIIHPDRILFCMRRTSMGWFGKYLITLKTKKSLKLYRNYSKRPCSKYWVTEHIPVELKRGHSLERDKLVDELKEHGYDGWYGTLHGNLTAMEYCIFDPLENLEVTDIITLNWKCTWDGSDN